MSENEKNLKKEKAQLRKLLDQNARGIKLLDSILGTTKSTGKMGTKNKFEKRRKTLSEEDKFTKRRRTLSEEDKFTKRRRTLSGKKK